MNRTHEFYPMITTTIKSLLSLLTKDQYSEALQILITYPRCVIDETCPPVFQAIVEELHRQHNRWNKGGNNA